MGKWKDLSLTAALAIAFGGLVVVGAGWLTIPVPLFLPAEGCGKGYCPANVPNVAVLPIVGAILLLAWARPGSLPRAIGSGFLVGLLASAYGGLVEVSAVPFREAYFVAPYRAYAVLYLTGLTAVAMALLLTFGWGRPRLGAGSRAIATSLVGVIAMAGVAALLRQELLTAASVATGIGAGFFLSRSDPLAAVSRSITERRALLAIFLAAVAARAIFGLQLLYREGPGMAFAIASDDGDSYYTMASGLAADPTTLADVLAARAFPPGYTLFVAGIFGLTGESLTAVVLAQAILGGIGAILVYGLARPFLGQWIALVPAALYALDMNLIQNQSTLTAEALLLPAILLALWALYRYRSGSGTRWLIVAAAALGLAYVTRNVAAMPLIAAAVLSWIPWRRDRIRLLLRDTAVVGLAVLVFSSPIALATAVTEGRPRLSTQLATVAWTFDGGPGYMRSNARLIELGIEPFEDPLGSAVDLARHPLDVLAFYVDAVPGRLTALLFLHPVGLFDPLLVANPANHPNGFDAAIRTFRTAGLGVALTFFIARWPWRDRPQVMLFALFALLYVSVFTLVFAPWFAFRYRIPIEPIRFVAESAGMVILVRAALGSWIPARLKPVPALEATA